MYELGRLLTSLGIAADLISLIFISMGDYDVISYLSTPGTIVFIVGLIMISSSKPSTKINESTYTPVDLGQGMQNGSTPKIIPNGWTCTNCKRTNASYVGTCPCGASKENTIVKTVTPNVIKEGTDSQHWVCAFCGARNLIGLPNCGCGRTKAETNRIVAAREKDANTTATNMVTQNEKSLDKAVEDLKKYKELLDLGIITQEEFDAKKKELL